MGLQYKLSKILIKLNCKVVDMSGLLKKIMLSASGFALLCSAGIAEARELTSDLAYSQEVRSGSIEFDDYVRQGQNLEVKYTNPNSPVLDPETGLVTRNPDGSIIFEEAEAVLNLTCVGDGVSPYSGFSGSDKWGGWAVESSSGVCYGAKLRVSDPYHLEAEATTKCDESSDISPDEKDYCTYDGTNVTGQTGDDMFSISPAGSGSSADNGNFIEYRKVGDMNSDYRLRWVTRTGNGDHSSSDMMIPSGPPGTFADYKTYMSRYLDASSSAPVIVEKGCFPIEVELCLNEAPIAMNDQYTLDEETTATFNVLENDYDNDNTAENPDPIEVVGISVNPKNGSVSWTRSGTMTYTPDNNFFGTDTFSYQIVDSHGAFAEATVTLTINNLPEINAKNDSVRINEDTTASFTIFSNDYNPNNYTLSLDSLPSSTKNGKLSVSSTGSVSYIPNANFYGTDSFTYKVYDQKGTYDTATATISVNSMGEINANNDSYNLCSSNGGSVGINVLGNDAGTGVSVISSSGISVSSNGSASLSPGNHSGSYTAKDYSYYSSTDSASISAHVSGPWTHTGWGACNATCGNGTQSATYRCDYAAGCNSCSAGATRTCNAGACTPPWGNSDPLILDLDGDGIELLNSDQTNAYFDLDLDGTAEAVGGWISGDDAFLVLDNNNDGIINDKSELFGDSDGFEDGFAKLSSYDSNNDGTIDMGDDVFASLQLWQDKDGDGFTDVGELMSIFDAGLQSISLSVEAVDNIINGQLESHRSSFTFDDGTEGQISEIWFQDK